MAGYWLARVEVKDPEQYFKYAKHIPELMKKWNAKIMARADEFTLLECNPQVEWQADFNRFVLIEFPTYQDAIDCFNSDDYQKIREHRIHGAGINELVIINGEDTTENQMT